MGYTHYFTPGKKEIDEATMAIVEKIIAHGVDECILETEGDQAVRYSPKEIWLNGAYPLSHETFDYKVGGEWGFCKTACKPYDRYVCALLLVLRFYAGCSFSSDGGMERGEWLDVTDFMRENQENFGLSDEFIAWFPKEDRWFPEEK